MSAEQQDIERLLQLEQEKYVFLSQALNLARHFARMVNSKEVTDVNLVKKITLYIKLVTRLMRSWAKRQQELRKAGNIDKDDSRFFGLDGIKEFSASIKDNIISFFNRGVADLGFIISVPLAIIAAVVIVTGSISAVAITDMLTTSAAEKEELLTSTAKISRELGLSSKETAKLISEVIGEDKSFFENLFRPTNLIVGAAVVLAWYNRDQLVKIFK